MIGAMKLFRFRSHLPKTALNDNRCVHATGTVAWQKARKILNKELDDIQKAGTWKSERVIISRQAQSLKVEGQKSDILNFCANNYLGLSSHPQVIKAGTRALQTTGSGVSSARYICGTTDLHVELEQKIARFHGREDAILYANGYDANAGIFEALFGPEDAVISDELSHVSIFNGIRLSNAHKLLYKHRDMKDLEAQLRNARHCRIKLVVTDGVFSMDGDVAPLSEICELANKYDAVVFVDENHSTGLFGPTGRGTEEYFGIDGCPDIINSTLGKALGGAAGGYTTGPQQLISLLRQRSKPYVYSNALAPVVVACANKALDLMIANQDLVIKLQSNTKRFRTKMRNAGFTVEGELTHPICPVIFGDARLASAFADEMLGSGIYVVGVSFPVVPKVTLCCGHCFIIRMSLLEVISTLIGLIFVLIQTVVAPHEHLVGNTTILFCSGDRGYHRNMINDVTLSVARSRCEETVGGYVVHLETASEQAWLYTKFMSIGMNAGNYWIGLEKAVDNTSDWYWVSGSSSTMATNLTDRWSSPTQPYNTAVAAYGNIMSYQNTSILPFVCETEGAPFYGYCFDNTSATFYKSQGTNVYNYMSDISDIDTAIRVCESYPNTHVINLESSTEWTWLSTLLGELSLTNNYWIGLRRNYVADNWYWVYPDNVTQPMNESNFDQWTTPTPELYAYSEYGMWKASAKTELRNFICETEIQSTIETTTASSTVPPTNSSLINSTASFNSTLFPSMSSMTIDTNSASINSTLFPSLSSMTTDANSASINSTLFPISSSMTTYTNLTSMNSTLFPSLSSMTTDANPASINSTLFPSLSSMTTDANSASINSTLFPSSSSMITYTNLTSMNSTLFPSLSSMTTDANSASINSTLFPSATSMTTYTNLTSMNSTLFPSSSSMTTYTNLTSMNSTLFPSLSSMTTNANPASINSTLFPSLSSMIADTNSASISSTLNPSSSPMASDTNSASMNSTLFPSVSSNTTDTASPFITSKLFSSSSSMTTDANSASINSTIFSNISSTTTLTNLASMNYTLFPSLSSMTTYTNSAFINLTVFPSLSSMTSGTESAAFNSSLFPSSSSMTTDTNSLSINSTLFPSVTPIDTDANSASINPTLFPSLSSLTTGISSPSVSSVPFSKMSSYSNTQTLNSLLSESSTSLSHSTTSTIITTPPSSNSSFNNTPDLNSSYMSPAIISPSSADHYSSSFSSFDYTSTATETSLVFTPDVTPQSPTVSTGFPETMTVQALASLSAATATLSSATITAAASSTMSTPSAEGPIYAFFNRNSSCDQSCRSFHRQEYPANNDRVYNVVMTSSAIRCARLCLNVNSCSEMQYDDIKGMCVLFTV